MKTRIYSLLVALMSVVAFTACDDWSPADQSTYAANTGGVSSSNMKVNVNESVTSISRAGVDTSGFLVTVNDKETGAIVSYEGKECSWTYAEMPSIFTLPVGQYTVTVRSHEPEAAAWDTPYYVGTSDFEVKNNQVTYIGTVTCRFAAIKVEVRFSDDLIKNMDPSSTVEVNAGTGTLVWSSTETRYGYFVPENEDNKTIGATFTGIVDGNSTVVNKIVDDAAEGSYYIFTFSLLAGNPDFPGETGTIVPDENNGIHIDLEVIDENIDSTVSPDTDVIDKDDKEHPDHEVWPDGNTDPDPDQPDQPITGDENESGVDMKVSDGIDKDGVNDVKDGQKYVIDFNTETPITGMSVTIDSPYLTEEFMQGINLSTELDLVNPGELEDGLTGLGLPVKDEVEGQTSLSVDLSGLIPLLNIYGATEGKSGIHKFILTVKTEGKPDFVHTLQFRNLL